MKKIVAFVFVVFVLGVWYRMSQAPKSDSELLELSPDAGKVVVVKRGQSDWQPPIGAYDLTVALDRSGSVSDADRAIGRAMVDSAAVRVLGKNRLQIAEFANAFETFGQAEGADGIKELLNRWRRSVQYPQDRQYTNITMTLANLLQRVVPVVKQGYLAEIIVVTDGDNDPPPEQDEAEYSAGIEEALRQIDYEHQDRLRIHIIEVGVKFAYRGAVGRDILKGRATTLEAKDWSKVAAVIEKLQSDLQGSFALEGNYQNLRIRVPEGEDTQTLGPFTLKLTGLESAKFKIRLVPSDPNIGDRLQADIKIGPAAAVPIKDSALVIKNKDRVSFLFTVDPKHEIEKHYMSNELWQPREWHFSLVVEPQDNLLPLIDLGASRDFTMHRDSLLFEDGLQAAMYLCVVGAALLLLLIIILYRLSGQDQASEEEQAGAEVMEHNLFGVVEYDDQRVALTGREQEVDNCLLFSRAPDGIHVMPYATFVMTVGHKAPETYCPDVVYVLPQADEVVLTEKQTGNVYRLVLRPTALHSTLQDKEVTVG